MKNAVTGGFLAELGLALLLACGHPSSRPDAGSLDAGSDGAAPGGTDTGTQEFTVAACRTDTCGAEATICGWGTGDPKYLGCLADCQVLGMVSVQCPEKAAALYACASLGAKVDCTTGKGIGCEREEQALAGCLPIPDGGAE